MNLISNENCWNFNVVQKVHTVEDNDYNSNFVLDKQRLNLVIQRRNALRSKYGESAFRLADVLRENCWNFCEKTDSGKAGQQKPGADSTLAKNIRKAAQRYPLSNGWFGLPQKCKSSKRRHVRQIITQNPVGDANSFYGTLASGGKEKPMEDGKGVQTDFLDDGSKVNKRIETSSKDSPAVEFWLNSKTDGIKPRQKVHFVKTGGETQRF